jgi:hypothetical protein
VRAPTHAKVMSLVAGMAVGCGLDRRHRPAAARREPVPCGARSAITRHHQESHGLTADRKRWRRPDRGLPSQAHTPSRRTSSTPRDPPAPTRGRTTAVQVHRPRGRSTHGPRGPHPPRISTRATAQRSEHPSVPASSRPQHHADPGSPFRGCPADPRFRPPTAGLRARTVSSVPRQPPAPIGPLTVRRPTRPADARCPPCAVLEGACPGHSKRRASAGTR